MLNRLHLTSKKDPIVDQNDKQAIQSLFDRIGEFGRQAPYRDRDAEVLIEQQMARQDGSAYYLAQTVVMQEQALAAAQAQLEALNAQVQQLQVAQQQQPAQGGFMSRLFGGSPAPQPQPQMQQPAAAARPMMAQPQMPQASSPFSNPQSGPFGQPAQRQGGGFLAGAAQTAMGVAGGMMLGNMLGGMFAGEAEAAPAADVPQPQNEAPPAEEMEAEEFDAGGFEDDSEW